MFSFRKKQKPPKNLHWVDNEPGLTPEQIEQKRNEGVKLVGAMFEANPETRVSVANFFRKKFAESTDPKVLEHKAQIEECLKEIEGEYYAIRLITFAEAARKEIAVWQKQTNPPMREIVRRETELKEAMEMISEIPARYQKGAREDFEELLAQMQKLQE